MVRPTRYAIVHRTEYAYSATVALAHGLAHLLPRATVAQTVLDAEVSVDPAVDHRAEYLDSFGNQVTYWSIEHGHERLSVVSRSTIELWPPVTPAWSPPWDEVAALVRAEHGEHGTPLAAEVLEAAICSAESSLVVPSAALADYASPSFPPGRPIVEAVADLTGRIHTEFEFSPGWTDVSTPIDTVLRSRRGVCQDFAHIAIGCMRSLGLPARYVSGYLETDPPPGESKLVGSDASHAWFAAYIPGWGWLDADPTNDLVPPDRHITVAWGRDYADVTPVRGVVFGPPAEQSLTVSVDVTRLATNEPADRLTG